MDKQHMTIEFTKDQYLALMKTVYLGDWLANAIRTKDYEADMRASLNLIMAHGADFGLDAYVDHDEEDGLHYASRKMEMESGMQELIEEYDDENFWGELIFRMAERDFERMYSRQEQAKMPQEQFFTIISALEGKYADETEKFGLDRLEIVAGE